MKNYIYKPKYLHELNKKLSMKIDEKNTKKTMFEKIKLLFFK